MPADAGGQTVQPTPPHAPRRDDVIAAQAVPVEAEADLDSSILDRHVGPAGAYPEQREHRVPPEIDADGEPHGSPPVGEAAPTVAAGQRATSVLRTNAARRSVAS